MKRRMKTDKLVSEHKLDNSFFPHYWLEFIKKECRSRRLSHFRLWCLDWLRRIALILDPHVCFKRVWKQIKINEYIHVIGCFVVRLEETGG